MATSPIPSTAASPPRVAVLMGSDSDLPVMEGAVTALAEFGIKAEVRVISAHRTPLDALEFAREATSRGLQVIIAGAGGAAHLAGVLAAVTPLPVIAVPIAATPLAGLDALLAMVQMPSGIPVATVAVNGARNAGLLAVRILAAADASLLQAMERFQQALAESARAKDARVRARYP